jgi:hypothetical protein
MAATQRGVVVYFFYVDESGNRDPEVECTNPKGESVAKDHVYVLAAVSLFEWRWSRFERALNGKKLEYIDIVRRSHGLAMKHAHFIQEGKASDVRLEHVVEMPLFVRSELSNGVQLADLVAYNVYRCFRYEDDGYGYFQAHPTNACLVS